MCRKENEQHDPYQTVLRLEVTTFSTQTMESVIHSIVSDFMNSTEQPNSFLNKEQVINQSITTESFTGNSCNIYDFLSKMMLSSLLLFYFFVFFTG